ncbi:hypothetical protein B0H13DRAFT_1900293 [Mycena leptocephala]|nr:hypothetical protein B0H13DRAFT_1900293 [Mycena leptocephala]
MSRRVLSAISPTENPLETLSYLFSCSSLEALTLPPRETPPCSTPCASFSVSSIAVLDDDTLRGRVTNIGRLVVPSQSTQITNTPLKQFIALIKAPDGSTDGVDLYPDNLRIVRRLPRLSYAIQPLLATNSHHLLITRDTSGSTSPIVSGYCDSEDAVDTPLSRVVRVDQLHRIRLGALGFIGAEQPYRRERWCESDAESTGGAGSSVGGGGASVSEGAGGEVTGLAKQLHLASEEPGGSAFWEDTQDRNFEEGTANLYG